MDIISLLDGTTETISGEKDFSDLVDKKLGYDAKQWFDKLVSGYRRQIKSLEEEIDAHQNDGR